MTPDVSIIVPIYNVENFLDECLSSLVGQSYDNIEIICVNDGSTDSSAEILEKWVQKDHRIKVLTQSNRGISVARNNGLKHAEGAYIMFVDADDALHPQAVELCLDLAKKENADVVNFNFQRVSANHWPQNEMIKSSVPYKTTNHPLNLCLRKHPWEVGVNVWSKLFKRQVLHNLWFVPGIKYEDYPYIIALFSRRMKSVVVKATLYFYRNNANSILNAPFTAKRIMDYHTGLTYLMNWYGNVSSEKDRLYLSRVVFPNLLNLILNAIAQNHSENRGELLQTFGALLRDLKTRGFLSWRGHKWNRYRIYTRIMKGKGVKFPK